ncbi:MAG: indole-3-glycerol phosphate synthase TrpC [Acidobacteria bacterium]|nr:indole-3-glycerol phosphate synthase TrpC [Acidobacteriota bacterium]
MTAPAKTGTILDRILEARKARLARRKFDLPGGLVQKAAETADPARDFPSALIKPGVNVIAEMKKASPSKGVIRADFEPVPLAKQLADAGAAALSVLTEEDFFQGDISHLTNARKAVGIPVLRKDFIFDSWQVWEARSAGADSFLLIAAILDDDTLHELLTAGRTLGMEALVEVHTRWELKRASDAGARIIGVNNRDLKTFEVRLETSLELAEFLPGDCIAVSESGIHSRSEIARLKEAGYNAFLIGEQLMQAADPAAALRSLLG